MLRSAAENGKWNDVNNNLPSSPKKDNAAESLFGGV